MERRNFLKNSGILAGGLLLDHKLFAAGQSADPVKVAVIGCGDRGSGLIHALNKLPELFRITAICDVLDFRLAAAKKLDKTGTWKTSNDYRKLLEHKNIDAVFVAVPLNMHYPIAKEVIIGGRHLYLEKTMTYNIGQAMDLVKLMQTRKNQVLQVGHQYRYSPLYYRVKDLIDNGHLGKITQVDCRWDRNNNWRRPTPDSSLEHIINWRMYKESSGGLVAELLSHQIDFINWIFNTHPQEFYATGGIDVFKDGRETYDNVQVMMRYPDLGMIGNFGSMCGNAHDGYFFKIKGTKGTISLLTEQGVFYPEKNAATGNETVDGVTGATQITFSGDGGIPILPEPIKGSTAFALKDFYQKIQTHELPDSNVLTGARTTICVHLANQALYSKQPCIWEDKYNLT